MNTIHYANLTTGKRTVVRVGQGGLDWLNQTGQRNAYGRLPAKHSRRRATMAEADRAMSRKGFVRWPLSKPLPQAQLKAAA